MQADLHQHLLGEPLLEALASRTTAPLTRREGASWVLEVPGERPHPWIPTPRTPPGAPRSWRPTGWIARRSRCPACSVWRACPGTRPTACSPPTTRAWPRCPTRFGRWASVSLLEPSAAAVEAQLEAGAVGLTLPAGALSTPEQVERLAPLLEPLARRERPLFVHPGPGTGPPEADRRAGGRR